MSRVSHDEVLLLYRALRQFRAGKAPPCAARGRPPHSECPFYDQCERWKGPDDYQLSIYETEEETERRRSKWPCSRVMELLGPEVSRIG
ncbi:MAG TPA: hypothetical protein VF444_06335 [Pseudonocardiaceae bacterium]